MIRHIAGLTLTATAVAALSGCSSSGSDHAAPLQHTSSVTSTQPSAQHTLNSARPAQPIPSAARVVRANPDDASSAGASASTSASVSTSAPASASVAQQGSPDATGDATHNAANIAYHRAASAAARTVGASAMPANRILIDGIAYASIVPEGITRGFLNIPQQAWRAGWQTSSAPLSATVGDSVIAGHVDFNRIPGVFSDLSKVKPGQMIWTSTDTGAITSWRVTRIATYPKGKLPQFWLDGDRRLQLVTCTGPLGWVDNASGGTSWLHQNNLVVTAVPA